MRAGFYSELPRVTRFVGLSGTGWLLDVAVLTIAVQLGLSVFTAGLLGALTGATFAFCASPSLAFRTTTSHFALKLLVYVIYSLLLALLIAAAIAWLSAVLQGLVAATVPRTAVALFAKVVITPFTLLANYLFARYLIVVIK